MTRLQRIGVNVLLFGAPAVFVLLETAPRIW